MKSREAHIITGALLGAVLTVGAIIAYENKVQTESLAGPIVYAPVVVSGAGVGGVLGYFVWRVRR